MVEVSPDVGAGLVSGATAAGLGSSFGGAMATSVAIRAGPIGLGSWAGSGPSGHNTNPTTMAPTKKDPLNQSQGWMVRRGRLFSSYTALKSGARSSRRSRSARFSASRINDMPLSVLGLAVQQRDGGVCRCLIQLDQCLLTHNTIRLYEMSALKFHYAHS